MAEFFRKHLYPFWRAMAAVLAGFIGIRKRRNAAADGEKTSARHIIVAGVVMLALFVTTLLLIVRSVL